MKERREIKEMTHGELVEKLHQIQIQKKCLVILDDIWKPEDWDRLSPAFPTKNVGSKILLTTRIREVASSVDQQCFLHELRTLTEAESWELFEKKAFLRRNDTEFRVSRETMELGKKMVKHCGGLPLAIVVLGRLLGTKHEYYDWETVDRNLSYHLSKGKDERVKDVLALSYQDLPYHLKACFLYLSHLPEDYGIHRQNLVHKWMAEGIVPTQVGEEETMLDVGMSYLDELVQRCMVQAQLTTYSRRVKFCRLHDLMRDLCLLKAQEENFFKVVRLQAFEDHRYRYQFTWADNSASSSSSLTKIRRLAVYYSGGREIDSTRRGIIDEIRNHHHHIRSCQFYCYGYSLESSGWREVELLFMSFKLLRNLDLEGIVVHADNKILLPKAIGDLIHLRYLSIKGSHFTELPSSIGNLGFLQTLDLRVSYHIGITIPNVLWKLKQLRHLYFKEVWPAASVGYNLRLDGLSKLEILEGFTPLSFDARCFHKLPNLRRIKVEVFPENLAVILKSPVLSNSNRLLRYSSFFISGNFRTEEEQSFLRQLLGCHHLQKLHLEGSLNLVKLPDQLPPNLTMLSLRECNLVEDPMPALGNLPNLRRLTICMKSYLGKEMVCPAPKPASGGGCDGVFPQLKYLCLQSFPNLEEWRVEKGAMPSLLHLEIETCPKLKEIPDGLRFITTLRELKIIDLSQALLDRLREGGEDFHKVQHVPSITLFEP